ncbi:SAM-dependent methyltransferase [Vibrio cidicii]|uniref:class I SAM-dependent DNA methyltransferase n=1 Tax=Vibrio cidicii TaxID=1763883 RepID=UPI0018C1D8FF|nr:class I SAM-dependent methyltransferase [Vibrio cidicii]MBG0759300.1 SAM-dependent methyltransferase [Vibrio cidicii]
MEAMMAHNWDEVAKEWESNPATEEFAKSVFNQLLDRVDLQGARVLDFGCGTGLLTQKMSPLVKDIVALDASEEMIEELDKKQLPNVEPVVDSLTRGLVAQHPAFRGQFDLVVASSVCAFVDDLAGVLDIAHSLLNPGGCFIHWDWAADAAEQGLEVDGLTEERVRQVLTNAGFVDVEVGPAFSLTMDGKTYPVLVGMGKRLS